MCSSRVTLGRFLSYHSTPLGAPLHHPNQGTSGSLFAGLSALLDCRIPKRGCVFVPCVFRLYPMDLHIVLSQITQTV